MTPAIELLDSFDSGLYLSALIAVAQTDGLRPEEVDFIQAQASLLEIPDVNLEAPQNLEALTKTMSNATKRIILRDCVVLASLDGDYSDKEKLRVAGIAHSLGLKQNLTRQIEVWVADYSRILETGQALMNGEIE